MGRRRPDCARRSAAVVTLAVVAFFVSALAASPARGAAGHAGAQVRVERESFWYDGNAASAGSRASDEDAFVPECVEHVANALDAVLSLYPSQFPQPPPLTIIVRAVPRERARSSALWSRSIGAYGCATLLDGIVVIELAPSICVGRDALDDAELRSFLGHELIHAYQFARLGDHRQEPDEIARREIEALEWESARVEPQVRAWYRDDLQFNLKMYRAMLPE